MTGKVHAGLALMALYPFNTNLELDMINIWFIGGAVIGSYLPDCDISTAPAGWVLPVWLFKVKHRTYTHSLFACAVAASIGTFVHHMLGAGIGFGYLLHLLADSCTPMRTKYLFWFPGRKIRA